MRRNLNAKIASALTSGGLKKRTEYRLLVLDEDKDISADDLDWMSAQSDDGWFPMVGFPWRGKLNIIMGRTRMVKEEGLVLPDATL